MSSCSQSTSPPAHSMVPFAFFSRPPGQSDICTRDGDCGNSYLFVFGLKVSAFFTVRWTSPSIDQVISSGFQSISYSWKFSKVSSSIVAFLPFSSVGPKSVPLVKLFPKGKERDMTYSREFPGSSSWFGQFASRRQPTHNRFRP